MRPDTLATGLPKGAWARLSTARVRRHDRRQQAQLT